MGVRSLALGIVALSACGFPRPAPFRDDAGGSDGNDSGGASHAFDDPANWAEFNLASGGGLVGAAFDGRYVYMAPDGDNTDVGEGVTVRYDTTTSFTDSSSWSTFDTTANLGASYFSYFGAFYNTGPSGGGLYLVPWLGNNIALHVDGPDFATPASWEQFDTTTVAGGGFTGSVFDGRYLYFCPDENSGVHSGDVLRYDTQLSFTSSMSWSHYDYAIAHPDMQAVGYLGGVYDPVHGLVYFIPYHQDGGEQGEVLLVLDTSQDFTTPAAWSAVDLSTAINGSFMGYGGGVFDGTYLYLVPTAGTPGGYALKYDTRLPIGNASSWSKFSTSNFDTVTASDYIGGAFDGKYVYYLPISTGKILRYDTTGDFGKDASWKVFDTTMIDPNASDFESAVYDGEYIYFAPRIGSTIVMRFDATDKQPLDNVYSGFTGSFL